MRGGFDEASFIGVAPAYKTQYYSFLSANTPAGGSILGDTGAVLAGLYDVTFVLSSSAAIGPGIGYEAQWRDATNAATNWGHEFLTLSGGPLVIRLVGIKVSANERFRNYLLNAYAAGALAGSVFAVRRS